MGDRNGPEHAINLTPLVKLTDSSIGASISIAFLLGVLDLISIASCANATLLSSTLNIANDLTSAFMITSIFGF